MDVIVKKEDDEESVITLEDFPFICRICLMRNDLRLFEEEESLFKLFHSITKIEAHSLEEIPNKICSQCIIKLEEISLFLEIAKNNHTILEMNSTMGEATESKSHFQLVGSKQENENESLQDLQTCRICLSPNGLLLLEKKTQLIQAFHNITGIDVKSEMNVCNICIDKLGEISSFINSSVDTDVKLVIAGKNIAVKMENCVKTEPLTDSDSKFEMTMLINEDELKQDAFLFQTEDEHEIIDIKEETIDSKLATTTVTTDRKNVANSSFWNEWNETHNGEKPYKCDYSNPTLTNSSDSNVHMHIHTVEKPYSGCNENFTDSSGSKNHMRTNTVEKPYKCDSCNKSFARTSYLIVHKRSHTGEKPYECDYCNKSFTNCSDANVHMRIHTGEKPYKCNCCDRRFIDSSGLKNHMRTHTGEKPYKCNFCDKSYAKSSALKIHERGHTGEKPYKCNNCDRSFTNTTNLKRHMRLHTGEKPYKCHCCDKSFRVCTALKTHLLSHTGEKPYKCESCEKSFTNSSVLKVHMRTHTREKPYTCNCCDKKFTNSSSFNKHMLTHTGEKPHECDCCDKSFARSSDLKIHMRTHSGEMP